MAQCIGTNKRGARCGNEARPGFSTCDVPSHAAREPGGVLVEPEAAPGPVDAPPSPSPVAGPDVLGPPLPPAGASAVPADLFAIPVGADLFASPIVADPEPDRWTEPEPAPAAPDGGRAAEPEKREPAGEGDGWGPDPAAVLGALGALQGGEPGPGLGVWSPDEVKGFLRDLYNPSVLVPLGKKPLSAGEIEAAGRYVTPAVDRWLSKLDPTDPTTAFWGWLLLTHGPRFGGDLLRLAKRAGERRRASAPTTTAVPASPPPPPPASQGW